MAGRGVWATLAAVAVAGSLAAAPAAQGRVTVTPNFTVVSVTVTGGPGDDRMRIHCEENRLVVNGREAANGRVKCSRLEELHIEGRRGNDRIALENIPQGIENFFAEIEDFLSIRGGPGDDRIFAKVQTPFAAFLGPGDDRLTAPNAFDLAAVGGPGDDWLITGSKGFSGILYGGPGSDRLTGGPSIGLFLGGPGADRIRGLKGTALGLGGDGRDRISGGPGTDLLFGMKGNDTVTGQRGRDLVAGLAGRDRLFGGPGADILIGGSGRDRLGGGPGRDEESQDTPPGGLDAAAEAMFEDLLGPSVSEERQNSARRVRRTFLALLERGHRQAR